jgi:hypothetical protein
VHQTVPQCGIFHVRHCVALKRFWILTHSGVQILGLGMEKLYIYILYYTIIKSDHDLKKNQVPEREKHIFDNYGNKIPQKIT